jgi:hypothetical protein
VRILRPSDPQVDTAKGILLANYFPDGSVTVFYGRQLELALERKFFHWITTKALNELEREGRIKAIQESLGYLTAKFYFHPRHRYPRRQIKSALALIVEYSNPDLMRAVGHWGEVLADVGFARVGFRIAQENCQEVDGKRWFETNHNLDRLITRDGLRWGVEIKNQLPYIDRDEFRIKLKMCEYLGVRPLFVARTMPANYIFEVYKRGGFCLLLDNQHYPITAAEVRLAKRLRDDLGLPVLSIRALPDTTMQRFEDWHLRELARRDENR